MQLTQSNKLNGDYENNVINFTQVYEIKLSISASCPVIFRKVLFLKNQRLYQLHRAIQIVFSWSDKFSHEFLFNNKPCDFKKEFEIKLKDINTCNFLYLYNRAWEIKIEIEKEINRKSGTKYPLCVDGGLASPNEKCGGLEGYYYIISILNNPCHYKYFEISDFFENEPVEYFYDVELLNRRLLFLN